MTRCLEEGNESVGTLGLPMAVDFPRKLLNMHLVG